MSARYYDFAEAAEELRELQVTESWLRRHSTRLPRTKIAGAVRFSDDDLERIRAMHHIEPAEAAPQPAPISSEGAPVLTQLKPLPSKRHARKSA